MTPTSTHTSIRGTAVKGWWLNWQLGLQQWQFQIIALQNLHTRDNAFCPPVRNLQRTVNKGCTARRGTGTAGTEVAIDEAPGDGNETATAPDDVAT